jgi:hypothetical protein
MRDDAGQTTSLGLIWGAERIAAIIDRSPETTWRLLEAGVIPARKIGSKWCTTHGKLKELFRDVLPDEAPAVATKPQRRTAPAER